MKILNLYAGIGGNRKLWGDEHEITAVEMNPKLAEIYKYYFPKDEIVIGDAHEYLRLNFKNFDFIWSSPPCQTHSSFRQNICVRYRGTGPKFPDMKLYEEIIFLQANADCKWVVENVKPYYKPLIEGKLVERHLFWSNFDIFDIVDKEIKKAVIRKAQIPDLEKYHGYDLSNFRLPNKRQVLRNCVYPELGKYIFDCAWDNCT